MRLVLDAGKTFQTIDGFGVNFNPAQWRKGNLQPAINLLVDDLGCTLFRFDPTGLAEWLDPARRSADGTWSSDYLAEVYTSQVFRDAWAAFRALNAKGIQPLLNVSGRIPAPLGRQENPKRLGDFDAYAQMVVSMAQWARKTEGLRFRYLAPFNETDYGYPEGPKIELEDLTTAIQAVLKQLDAHGMSDVQLILADDAEPSIVRTEAILKHPEWNNRIGAFAFHTYGNGDESESAGWQGEGSLHGRVLKRIRDSAFAACPVWMTEYGDLDQSGIIEHEIGWRSTRRLLKFLNEGYSAGLIWDAFDNVHKHDAAWSSYGVLATETNRWRYAPKPRYYAARQVFRSVKPGFVRISTQPIRSGNSHDPYAGSRDPFRHLLLSAFVSPERADFTLVGMNRSESDMALTVSLRGFDIQSAKKSVRAYSTSATRLCRKLGEARVSGEQFTLTVGAKSIFTLTSLK